MNFEEGVFLPFREIHLAEKSFSPKMSSKIVQSRVNNKGCAMSGLADSTRTYQGQKKIKEESQGFGTFIGVFVPSILMVFGVIIFLRMGWIVGQVGLSTALMIITFATFITMITTCLSLLSPLTSK